MFGRYYFMDFDGKLRIVDEEAAILLKEIDKTYGFCFDNNHNIILVYEDPIKYLSYNGDLLKMEYKIKEYECLFLFNYNKS